MKTKISEFGLFHTFYFLLSFLGILLYFGITNSFFCEKIYIEKNKSCKGIYIHELHRIETLRKRAMEKCKNKSMPSKFVHGIYNIVQSIYEIYVFIIEKVKGIELYSFGKFFVLLFIIYFIVLLSYAPAFTIVERKE